MYDIISGINSVRTYTWGVLEAYGWLIVFSVASIYVIYKKYIYSFLEKQKNYESVGHQKKFDKEVREENDDRVRRARLNQQESLNAAEAEAKKKRDEKEKEALEKRMREASVLDAAVGRFVSKKREPVKTTDKSEQEKPKSAEEVFEMLIKNKPIVVFTKSFCPFSRKVRQLIATYRLDSNVYEFIDLDQEEQGENISTAQIQKIFEDRYEKKSVPKMFIHGQYIGGYDEIIQLSREGSFEAYFK